MAKSDFYPVTDARKLSFLENFLAALGSGAGSTGHVLGLSDAELAALTAARDNLQDAIAQKLAKKNAAQAATAAWKGVDKQTETLLRASVRRLKTHPAYTPAHAELLGVTGPDTRPEASAHPRPDLAAQSVRHGEVTLGYLKNGYSGVEIRSKRGDEKEFTFLARDTQSPYVDTRPNLNDAPETRYYLALYLQKDKPVGENSDVLVVTVPGKG